MSERVWSIEDHLEGRTDGVREMYCRLIEMVELCGPFTYAVSKTAITLKGTRRGFAGAIPKHDRLDGYVDLQRRVDDPRILSSSPYTKRLFVLRFRLIDCGQLDGSFAALIREAYAVGQGAHLVSRRG